MGNHITLEKVAEIRLRKQKRVMNAYFCEYTVGDVKVEAIYIAPSRGTVRSITVLNYRESYGKDSPIRFTYPMRITLVEKNLTDEGLICDLATYSRKFWHRGEDGKWTRTTEPTDEDCKWSWGKATKVRHGENNP